jgi:hypothetical protein
MTDIRQVIFHLDLDKDILSLLSQTQRMIFLEPKSRRKRRCIYLQDYVSDSDESTSTLRSHVTGE